MYGTIAKFRVKPGVDKNEFKRKMDEFDSSDIPGWVADYIFQMDADSDEYYLVAVFKDRETYLANADDHKQHERYLIFRSFLADDPKWNDGFIISATGPGSRLEAQ
ncbi:MAG: antibiotic biosynthesis monooxygenase [Anaerolineales bacterium]|nr:MAG: antibiotic biosynthesis monooxygenase [Anaerolineales bacterium]